MYRNTKLFTRPLYIFATIALCIGSLLNADESTVVNLKNKNPNIIFFLADDQDKGDYGCYGNGLVHTPAVDRLASEGMIFENAFTGQAICAPSRSQLYTGNYPVKNGCFLNHTKVKKNQKSISSYLNELGYDVILAGKSHVKPASVFKWNENWPLVEKTGYPRKYIPFDKIDSYFQSAEKPFCMFITSGYPHGPFFEVENAQRSQLKAFPYTEGLLTLQENIDEMAGYYRNIQEDNTQLEMVLQSVDDHLSDNTLFIYSADHGMYGKYTVYDRGLNVPFIARWPGVIGPQSKTDVIIHFTDVLPSFVELAGGTAPTNVDGKSFLSVLSGSSEPIHKYVYGIRTSQNILAAKVFPSRMIRSKKYKLIRNPNSIEVYEQNLGDNQYVNAFIKLGAEKFPNIPYEELYDLENDPYEQNNLANDPAYSAIKEELATDLVKWMKEQGDFLTSEPGTMPLLKARYKLDKSSKYNSVPSGLENTLTKKDYLYFHY